MARLPERLQGWLDAEQQLVHRRVDRRLIDPGDVSEIPEPWRPESGRVVRLRSVLLALGDVELEGEPPPGFVRGGAVRFLWHPLVAVPTAIARAPAGAELEAAVTSSIRTLLVWGAGAPHFVKLGLPRVVAGEARALGLTHARRAVDATQLLDALGPVGFSICREPFAMVPKRAPLAGLIVRQVPRGRWRPFFALTHSSARLPVGLQRRLLEGAVKAWLRAAIDFGLSLELHAQNLLVQVDARGLPTGRFGYRDLDGLTADAPYLERRWPAHRRLVERLASRRTGLFDDPDEWLEASFFRFFLGGPAAGFDGGQAFASACLGSALGVDGRSPKEVVAAVLRRRSERLRPPRPPRAVRRFLDREQGLNERRRDPRFFAPVQEDALPSAWRPASHPVFVLDALVLRPDEVELLPNVASPWRRGRRRWLFVHPFMRERLGLLAATRRLRPTPYFAAPTSSPRSLIVWDRRGRVFGLKVSLDVELLGLSRLVHGSKLRRATTVDAAVAAIDAPELRRRGLTILREPAALRVRERDDGQLLRRWNERLGHAVAGFGLLAPGGPLDRLSAPRFEAVLVARVLEPLARAAAFLMLGQGLIGQLHQQNVLFELEASGLPSGRLLLRDLDSFVIDARVRRSRGLSTPRLDRREQALQLEQATHRYDDAWGRSCRADFAFLAELASGRRGITPTRRRALVYATLDRSFLLAALEFLGASVIGAELRWVLSRRRGAQPWRAFTDPARVLREAPGSLWSAPEDRKTPLYSVNALVNASLARRPG